MAGIFLGFSWGMPAHAQLIALNPATPADSFAQLDYNQLYLQILGESDRAKQQQDSARQELVKSGVVSSLDLRAPGKAVDEFNRAVTLIREQKSKDRWLELSSPSVRTSLKQTLREAEDAGVTIYPVSTREDSGPKTDADRILDALAERTGGESMFPGSIFALNGSLDRLGDLIRSRYLLAYKPAGFQPDGKYRAIAITAARAGKRLQVHARKGYYARAEASHD